MLRAEKRERAWYLIARDQPTTVQSMGRVGEGYKLYVGSVSVRACREQRLHEEKECGDTMLVR